MSQTLDIKLWRTLIFSTWEMNEVSPIIALVYCLKEVSRPPSKEKELRRTMQTLSVEETELRIWGDQHARVFRQGTREQKLCRKKTQVFSRVPHMYVWGDYQRPGKESLERGSVLGNYKSSGNSAGSLKPNWKTSQFIGHWAVYWEGSCLSSGT